MAKEADHEVKEVAVEIKRITGFKTAYGNDSFDGIGVSGPFVRVDIDNAEKKSFSNKVFATRNAVLKILDRFYKKHSPVDLGSRFVLRSIGIYGDFLIVNQNADIIATVPKVLQKKALGRHTKEFVAFAKFLKKSSI
jgi:hypothetical protein